MTDGRAIVVGDALLDVRVAPTAPMRPGADVPATISLQPGGQGANVAVRLARLGVPVELACAIGDDPAGTLLRRALAVDGVTIVELPADATGTVVVLAGDAGERTMFSQRLPSAAAAARLEWRDREWVVVSGYVLAEAAADPLAATMAGIRRRVVLGCALAEAQVGPWSDRLTRIRPDLLVLNRDEARAVGPVPDGTILVVTHADGARARFEGEEIAVVGGTGLRAADTTGAGDAFAAALVAALARVAWPPTVDALRTAMSAGVQLAAEVARVIGAQAPVPSETAGMLR